MSNDYRQFSEEEIKWAKRLQTVMNSAPKNNKLFLFAGDGDLVLYPERVHTAKGYVDGNAPNIRIKTNIEVDGGDW